VNLFKKLRGASAPGVVTLQCRASEVGQTLASASISPTFVSGYVSPHVDIEPVARAVTARFPGVPVEVWPIEEFTYLQPARWNGTRSAERLPHPERYWSEADPEYCDGEGAESFANLLRRCEAALARLAAMPAASLVYVFGHGQFIQAARAIVADAHLDDRGKMLGFWHKGEPPAISNAQQVGFHWQGGRWGCAPAIAA